ncbi:hypothetical protein [Lacticaseibacillus camelliae]|uniref:hypothetical protein n=1 Tax=Lacticaseibacillus camelliae TaxID=381742 RepID=UPI0012E37B32|nr:hypothetical protein [Lacticaseibacillus camelliae]
MQFIINIIKVHIFFTTYGYYKNIERRKPFYPNPIFHFYSSKVKIVRQSPKLPGQLLRPLTQRPFWCRQGQPNGPAGRRGKILFTAGLGMLQ